MRKPKQAQQEYMNILERVQSLAKVTFVEDIVSFLDDEMVKLKLKNFIKKTIIENGLKCNDIASDDELVNLLFNDMTQYGFLTGYLLRQDIEEININAYDDVDIMYRNGTSEKITNGFYTPKFAYMIVSRLLAAQSKAILNDGKPIANAHLNANTRIVAVAGELVDDDVGVICSIRFIGQLQQDRQALLQYGTANDDMFDFLEACVNFGISVCVGGACGAGKTSTCGFMLNTLPNNIRVFSCEEGSREVNLVRRTEQGERINSVVQLKTLTTDDKEKEITLTDLLRVVLRLDPDVIFVSEMRSIEAYIGQEAARTGHTVLTTTHCNSAPLAYSRMVTLSKEAVDFSDETLHRLMVEAFPVIVYQKQLRDGSRKITQIIEGEGFKNGELIYRVLWQYTTKCIKEKDGKITIDGMFEKVNGISNNLAYRFIENGLPKALVDRFL